MKLRLSRQARADLDRIAAYIGERDPQAAARVQRDLTAALDRLLDHPQAGRPTGRGLRRFAVPRLPYLILYRVDETTPAVAVVTIRHAARRPLT